ncbi:MAG: precorrin-6Y C5,15-methyltransferase (decarboxylating) subunit CbiT [Nitrososphaeraceae archaeon]|nr:precorrin-6Y C5,15-methyltransferase (decarboxylating) subunit CbiT [Nitrososphaeraceae archaeon]
MLWNYKTTGIPDELFLRAELVPITKEEIRAIVLSKLRLKETDSIIDIGCGSGSITVELCLQCTKGNVYAVDMDKKALDLTKKNLDRFRVNAILRYGKFQDIIDSFPTVNGIVIGGTNGEIEYIIERSINKLEKEGRLVITTIQIDTMYRGIKSVKESNLLKDLDFTQISVLKGKNTPTGTMMLARNPVLIISATKK